VLLAIPPFPYQERKKTDHPLEIFFSLDNATINEHVHFEEVAIDSGRYYSVGTSGYVGYVTGLGDTVPQSQSEITKILEKIHIPRVMYRNDIGTDFYEWQCRQLLQWGILSKKDLPKTKKKFWFI
jgi:phosphoribosylamine-glycine ligase